ncbi:uncharacterized protein LOC124135180 [Haliotis rufescens]|uniref:uncharacterized protein LOC124135180 n=1 Tax=Haliotis rufescens TaxID=6454 RepID=UPI00201F9B8B|nr:uncharacterized protein LOC124135180 [Haliotis rufescens]
MAAPMQHVRILCCRSFNVLYTRSWNRHSVCNVSHQTALGSCLPFSSRSNDKVEDDFFGIKEDDGRVENESVKQSRDDEQLQTKYSFRVKQQLKTYSRYSVPYGIVRKEEQIRSKEKKQSTKHTSLSSKRKDLFQENKYGVRVAVEQEGHSKQDLVKQKINTGIHLSSQNERENIFDEQYFQIEENPAIDVRYSDNDFMKLPQFASLSENYDKNSSRNDSYDKNQDLSFVDSQYFYSDEDIQRSPGSMKGHTPEYLQTRKYGRLHSRVETEGLNFVDKQYFDTDAIHSDNSSVPDSTLQGKHSDTADYGVKETVPLVGIDRIPRERGIRRRAVTRQQTSNQDEDGRPLTAYDVARKLRENSIEPASDEDGAGDTSRRYAGPVDSKGYRILKHQVDDVMTMPSVMVTRLLQDSIIYNKGDIIAIDKPYGLPSHGGPGVHTSVGQLLPALARLVDHSDQLDTLHLVHRLDRQTTGVMLLAKTAEMAWQLKSAFKRREVVKKYWVLTKGVPNPLKAVVDIPIGEGTVGRFHRMVLKPESTTDTRLVTRRSSTESHQAITEFEVLDSHGNAALVECTPLTGLKHQIRVHLAFGLNTPVLGDHKYSHITKVAPQRLHPDLLHRLGIRQSKVRHLPMLLHAKSILIPGFLDGRNLSIQTRLPRHFSLNMNRLKIKPPRNR